MLSSDESGYSFEVTGNASLSALTVTLTEGEALTVGIFELWVIPEGGVPQSLGTFAPSDRIEITGDIALREGSLLAVSIEPAGGSPTGAPTGPVVAVGQLG